MTTSDAVATPVIEEVVVSYAPGDDITPPSVVSTDPADGASGVPVDTDITINYNEPINPATFNATINGGVSFATTFAAHKWMPAVAGRAVAILAEQLLCSASRGRPLRCRATAPARRRRAPYNVNSMNDVPGIGLYRYGSMGRKPKDS